MGQTGRQSILGTIVCEGKTWSGMGPNRRNVLAKRLTKLLPTETSLRLMRPRNGVVPETF